jgi:hypothetical protein
MPFPCHPPSLESGEAWPWGGEGLLDLLRWSWLLWEGSGGHLPWHWVRGHVPNISGTQLATAGKATGETGGAISH